MPQEPALSQSKKALYLFLCAILGMILFVFIQQSFWIIYIDLSASGYLPHINPLNPLPLITLVAAFLLGMWYGVWLGLYWYEIVYERGGAKWFYAFKPGRKNKKEAPTDRLPWDKPGISSRADANRWKLDDLFDDGVQPEPETDAPGRPVSVAISSREVKESAPKPKPAPAAKPVPAPKPVATKAAAPVQAPTSAPTPTPIAPTEPPAPPAKRRVSRTPVKPSTKSSKTPQP